VSDSRIQTAYGNIIDPINPREEDIFIEDIAHALSNQCRYAGHVRTWYSVAEHAVRVSQAVPEEFAFEALHHDDSEAYLIDIPSPLKTALFGDLYREVEERLMNVIHQKFNIVSTPESRKAIHYADVALLKTEVRDLLTPVPDPQDRYELWEQWTGDVEILPEVISPVSPEVARNAYIAQHYILSQKREELQVV